MKKLWNNIENKLKNLEKRFEIDICWKFQSKSFKVEQYEIEKVGLEEKLNEITKQQKELAEMSKQT